MLEIHKMSDILKNQNTLPFLKLFFKLKEMWHQGMLSELESTIGNNSSCIVLSQ